MGVSFPVGSVRAFDVRDTRRAGRASTNHEPDSPDRPGQGVLE